jgi:thioredoxin 1
MNRKNIQVFLRSSDMKSIHILFYASIIMLVLIAAAGCGKKKNGPSSSDTHQDSRNTEESTTVTEVESASQFSQIISENDIVMVDFYADWCGPCRQLKPIIHDVAVDFAGKVKVIAVNVDTLRNLAIEYEVSGIPDVRVFKGGTQAKKFVGVQLKTAYAGYLKSFEAK